MKQDKDKQPTASHHLALAYAHQANGNLAQALNECDAIIAADPSLLAEAHNLRGIILDGLGRSAEATDAYIRAVALKPGFHEAAENLRDLEMEIARQCNLVAMQRFANRRKSSR